ncbi:MAG TPA: P-II family nitrogen regulator [Armatimonadota bacterium]|jgi:nitrogen regulatory protein P-II 1
MTKVEAFLRPASVEEVRKRLQDLLVNGLTVTEVRGCGKQRGFTQHYRGAEYAVTLIPKVKVETVVQDEQVEDVVDAILDAARTGEIGDGKVFTSPVSDVVRVRTGERGRAALL